MIRVRSLLAIAMFALVVSGDIAAAQQRQTAARAPAGEKSRPAHDQYDADRDGTITRAEFLGYQERRFTALDRDRNGAVSRAEFGLRGRTPQAKDKRRDGEFKAFDANRDGTIAKAEWLTVAEARFAKLAQGGDVIAVRSRPSSRAKARGSAARQ